jgi:hypothetical protein
MSEEQNETEGGMSTIKKTIIGIVTTVATAAGAYVTTQFNSIMGIEEEETGAKTEVVVESNQQQSQANNQQVIVNIPQQQSTPVSTNTVIRETVREVPAAQPAPAAAPVEEKKETNAERIARLKAKKAENGGN